MSMKYSTLKGYSTDFTHYSQFTHHTEYCSVKTVKYRYTLVLRYYVLNSDLSLKGQFKASERANRSDSQKHDKFVIINN